MAQDLIGGRWKVLCICIHMYGVHMYVCTPYHGRKFPIMGAVLFTMIRYMDLHHHELTTPSTLNYMCSNV